MYFTWSWVIKVELQLVLKSFVASGEGLDPVFFFYYYFCVPMEENPLIAWLFLTAFVYIIMYIFLYFVFFASFWRVWSLA